MKTTFKKSVLVALVTIAFGIGQSFAGNNNGVTDENCKDEVVVKTEKAEKAMPCDGTLTDAQIINYLYAHGYSRVRIISWQVCNAICDTAYSYNTIVYTDGNNIIGHADMPQ